MDETIFAVATGSGRAAICIIRVSGPSARNVLLQLAGKVPLPRVATLARLREPTGGETLDQAIILFFEARGSETGEDCAELHLHGGRAVVAAVLGVIAAVPGLRAAEPGEFAQRAFRNGKMDLAQIEGLADLIEADTQWQRRQAQRQLSGAMREATAPWRAALIEAAGQIETAIDFTDDVDLEDSVRGDVLRLVTPVRDGLRRELAQGQATERLRDGVQVVIAGPPNAGKSSLLNALAQRDAAIVTATAGTTRDPIEVHMDLGGCPVTLIDTAGLRESADSVERIGMDRARQRAAAADLVLWLSEGEEPPPTLAAPVWRLYGKADLREAPQDSADASSARMSPSAAGQASASLFVSAVTGRNVAALLDRLAHFARDLTGDGATGVVVRLRHRTAFEAALAALDHVGEGAAVLPIEILAEDLRAARHALDRLIGAVDVEDILGDIFSRFCIGK